MKIKTYDFTKYEKVYVADGNGGFDTINKDELTGKNEVLVVGHNATSHIEWEFDGTAYNEFYTKDEFGNIVKIESDYDMSVSCCVINPKSKTGKSFSVEYEDGILVSTCVLRSIVDKNGVLTSQKIVVKPGRYRRDDGHHCGCAFVVNEMNIYNDDEHAAWYSAPVIDKEKVTPRADLVRIDDTVLNSLTTRFIELKAFADANNIKLIVNEYSGEIHAVKVPEGYDVKVDEGDYANTIPWELMPVIGAVNCTMNEDSDYQPTLVKKKIGETNQN